MARMDTLENKRLRTSSDTPMQVRGSAAQEELPAEKVHALLKEPETGRLLKKTNARGEK